MFYSNLPKKAVKLFDAAYNKYSNPERIKKIHENDFKIEECKYFYRANEILYHGKNKHLKFLNNNIKYSYDSFFSYLEKEDNLIILYMYSKKILTHLMFFELDTGAIDHFWAKGFKRTNVLLMVSFNTKYEMGLYNGWSLIYSYAQRIRDKESIEILKSIDKFKYLPIELFDKINYFKLLQASDEMIHHYEILLKVGAIKLATGLMISGDVLTKEHFKEFNNEIKANRSYGYILDLISPSPKKQREQKSILFNDFLNDLYKNFKTYWEYNNYIFRIPKSISDIKKESQELNHCLYDSRDRYLNRMINKNNIILLMRKKDNIDSPFYTIEIVGESINQVRSKNNSTSNKITKVANEFFNYYKQEVLELYN